VLHDMFAVPFEEIAPMIECPVRATGAFLDRHLRPAVAPAHRATARHGRYLRPCQHG
jgi:hypothetical protein